MASQSLSLQWGFGYSSFTEGPNSNMLPATLVILVAGAVVPSEFNCSGFNEDTGWRAVLCGAILAQSVDSMARRCRRPCARDRDWAGHRANRLSGFRVRRLGIGDREVRVTIG